MFFIKLIEVYRENSRQFLEWSLEHIFMCVIAITVTCIVGLLLGILASKNKRAQRIIIPAINFIYTIPSVTMFFFLLPVLGIGKLTAITTLAIYGTLPIAKNTYTGFLEVDKSVKEAARCGGCSSLKLLWHIELPLASSMLLAGIRISVVMTIALSSIAPLIGAGGLGTAIWQGNALNDLYLTFSGSLIIAISAVLADWLIHYLENSTRKRLFG